VSGDGAGIASGEHWFFFFDKHACTCDSRVNILFFTLEFLLRLSLQTTYLYGHLVTPSTSPTGWVFERDCNMRTCFRTTRLSVSRSLGTYLTYRLSTLKIFRQPSKPPAMSPLSDKHSRINAVLRRRANQVGFPRVSVSNNVGRVNPASALSCPWAHPHSPMLTRVSCLLQPPSFSDCFTC